MNRELRVTSLNRAWVGFIRRWPLAAIALAVGLVVAIGLGMPKVQNDYTHKGFFYADDPKVLRFDAFERRFGNDDAVMVALHSPSGVFDMESAALLKEVTARMWQVPEVIRVDSLANYNWVHANGDDITVESLIPDDFTPAILAERRAVALADATLPNYLVNKDATTAVVIGRLRPGIESPPNEFAVMDGVRSLVRDSARGDHQFYILGGPAINYAFAEISQIDGARLLPMALIISAVFLLLLLRSFVAVVLSFVAVAGGVCVALGFAGWTGLVQTSLSTIVPSILIAVGVAESVHILQTFLAKLRSGMPRRDAAHYALTKNLLATFLTSLTTAVGFFSLCTASLKGISTLGWMAGVGTVATWLVCQLLVGGLLFILPIKAKPVPVERQLANERRADRMVSFIARNRFGIIGASVAFSALALWLSLSLDVNADTLKYFREGTAVRVASDFFERTMGNARSIELVVDSGKENGVKDPAFLAKVDQLQSWMEQQPHITRTVSIVDALKSTHKALNGDDPAFYRLADSEPVVAQELFLYTMGLPRGMDVNDRLSVKNDALRITVFNNLVNSSEAVSTMDRVSTQARSLGLDVQGTGKYYLYQEMNGDVVRSFLTSLSSAALLIGLIMSLFLRSLKLGIISMLPNVIPLFAGGALLRLMGQDLDIGTVLVASVCLGISVDDTSHVLANFAYARRQGLSATDALREVMASTAPSLLSANAILITSFASFATATFMPNVYFGILTSFILAVALIADMFFTPALVLEGKQPVDEGIPQEATA